MKPVDQTKFGKPEGNCFAACLASILEVDLDTIPDFGWDDNWRDRVDSYLAEFGFQMIDILIGLGAFKPLGYHIINGGSPRGDFDHSIVGYRGEPVHDPHPEGNCILRDIDTYTLFVALNE